jgi:hypothetical protein
MLPTIPTLRVRVLPLRPCMSPARALCLSKRKLKRLLRKNQRRNQALNRTAAVMNHLTRKKNRRRKRKPLVKLSLQLNNLLKPPHKSNQLLRRLSNLWLNNQRHKTPYSTFSVVSQAVSLSSNPLRTHLLPQIVLLASPPSHRLVPLDCKPNLQFKMRLDCLHLKILLDFQ